MSDKMSSETLKNIIYNICSDIFKHWTIIMFISVSVALGFDLYQTATYKPQYRCEATFVIDSGTEHQEEKGNGGEDIANSFTYIFSSNVFKNDIQKIMNVKELNGTYSAVIQPNTNILHVYADAKTSKLAFEMMKALKQNYQRISKLVVGDRKIDVMGTVVAPNFPYNNINHKRNIVFVGGLTGLIMIIFFGLVSIFKNTMKDKSEVESKLNLHLIGSLPKEKSIIHYRRREKADAILINQFSTSFHYVEVFKKIRIYLENYYKKHHANVLLVTSSVANEGKTSVSVNIALSLAMKKKKILLIDGDLRKPSLKDIFEDKKYEYGTENVLKNEVVLGDAVVKKSSYLDILYSYNTDTELMDHIDMSKINDLIQKAKNEYDYVIIDSSPSRYISDASLFASYADGIVLVVRQNFAVEDLILRTIDKLSITNTPIIGCIYNQCISSGLTSSKYYGYKYGYNHNYQNRGKEN